MQNFNSSYLDGLHVAIIMDGSGRWARQRGLPRTEGHRAGVRAVIRVVEAASGLGVTTLTLHAFSSDNWQRPAAEVKSLLRIFEDYLRSQVKEWRNQETRVTVFGRRDRLPETLLRAITDAESATCEGRGLHLLLAIDYSSRDAILRAAAGFAASKSRNDFRRALTLAGHDNQSDAVPDVDLVIRTGGEQRLSDFMLWECAYAELYFTPRLWPDFEAGDFAEAVREFHSRDRRFGRIPEPIAV